GKPVLVHAYVWLGAVTVNGTLPPVPVSGIVVNGFTGSFDGIMRFARRVPAYVGLKVTLTVQVAAAVRGLGLIGQLVVTPKSAAFVPAIVGRLTRRFAAPALVTVTVFAALVVRYA